MMLFRQVVAILVQMIWFAGAISLTVLGISAWQTALARHPWLFAALIISAIVSPLINLSEGALFVFLTNSFGRLHGSFDSVSERIRRGCRHARTTIKIADTYFGSFDTFRPALTHFLASRTRGRVQILLANPQGMFVEVRGSFSPDELRSSIQTTLGNILAFKRQLGPEAGATRIEIKFFDAMIPGPLVIIDDKTVFCGAFLQVQGSQHAPVVEYRHPFEGLPDPGEQYRDTFEKLWSDGISAPIQ